MVVPIDDYQVVLGMEFMEKYEAMMVPHIKKLYIYDVWENDPLEFRLW